MTHWPVVATEDSYLLPTAHPVAARNRDVKNTYIFGMAIGRIQYRHMLAMILCFSGVNFHSLLLYHLPSWARATHLPHIMIDPGLRANSTVQSSSHDLYALSPNLNVNLARRLAIELSLEAPIDSVYACFQCSWIVSMICTFMTVYWPEL